MTPAVFITGESGQVFITGESANIGFKKLASAKFSGESRLLACHELEVGFYRSKLLLKNFLACHNLFRRQHSHNELLIILSTH